MSYENVGRLVDKWLNDEKFRQQLRRDPKETVRGCNANLSKEEQEMLNSIDWSLSDEILKTRINLAFG